MGPLVARLGTTAVSDVSETTLKRTAGVPLNSTAVVPVKPVPVMVTVVPTGPLSGVKLVMVGAGITVKLELLVAVPPGALTLIGPVVAVAGTVAEIEVSEMTVNVALTPLNLTAVAPVKFVPVIVTLVPAGPLVGVKLVNVGSDSGTSTIF